MSQTVSMELRPYVPEDREACLAIFDSNTPRYFHPVEREGFSSFLEHPDGQYFVMEHERAIIGCGGYEILTQERFASLVWGMILADMQGNGLGRYLLLFRLREIGKAGDIEAVRVATSQHAQPFFEKQGFKVMGVVPEGFAPGMDRVEMIMKLKVCS